MRCWLGASSTRSTTATTRAARRSCATGCMEVERRPRLRPERRGRRAALGSRPPRRPSCSPTRATPSWCARSDAVSASQAGRCVLSIGGLTVRRQSWSSRAMRSRPAMVGAAVFGTALTVPFAASAAWAAQTCACGGGSRRAAALAAHAWTFAGCRPMPPSAGSSPRRSPPATAASRLPRTATTSAPPPEPEPEPAPPPAPEPEPAAEAESPPRHHRRRRRRRRRPRR